MPEAVVRISAKNLGAIALPTFCPRCFWTKLRMGNRLPYQIFPGVFSSIDAYTKHIVHGHFDRHNVPPSWLSPLGDLTGYVNPPHFSKFYVVSEETEVALTGTPDAVFIRPDDSYLIADYKTARYTDGQDALLPEYQVQLNAYAYIGEHCPQARIAPVTGLALLYFEPVSHTEAAHDGRFYEEGFHLDFAARVVDVPLDLDQIKPLLRTTREIFDIAAPPEPAPACTECLKVEELIYLVSQVAV